MFISCRKRQTKNLWIRSSNFKEWFRAKRRIKSVKILCRSKQKSNKLQKWTLIDNSHSKQISMKINKTFTKILAQRLLPINQSTLSTALNFTTPARKLSKTSRNDSSTSPLKWWTTTVPITPETTKRNKNNSKLSLKIKLL